MRKRNWKRHELLCLVAGIAEHDALIARADLIVGVVLAVAQLIALVDAHCDIG